ncbi:DUF3109 family protein [Puteibacter caeruleilacunae]|nr:DUF3109 family protein [Puteibacter caeruleilacunae]
MLQIGRAIISLDIIEKHFLCDLKKCKGACCVEGDSGAPLTKEEAKIIKKNYKHFKPYICEKNQQEVDRQGYSVIDQDGDLVTPLVNNRECVYVYTDEDGTTKCAIERAYLEGKISFRKPVSCHLFPIRITEYEEFDAVNYQQLDICIPARLCGHQHQVRLYKMLREPLIRKYGEEWYKELEIAVDMLEAQNK